MTAFFTVLGNLGLIVATILFGVPAMILGWLPPRGRWMYLCARLWSHALLWTAGVRVRRRFEVPLDPKKGYVFMANHQSLMDIPVLLTTLPGETRMLAKKGLFQIPVFGWSLKAGGFIPVDRGNRAAAKETFQAAIRCLEEGHSVLVFPEETRSKDGELLPFKPGGFLMALKTGFPIVPVGIEGTLTIRRRDSLVIQPGKVEISYGRPIEISDYGVRDRKQLTDEVRQRILERFPTQSI